MKNVAILLEQQYEDLELWYPYFRLKEAGFHPVFVGPVKDGEYKGKFGYPARVELGVADVKTEDFAAVIIPGGFAPDYLRRTPAMVEFVRAMWENGKIVAAICHGVWIPVSANIIRDKRVTSFFSIRDDVVNAGGLWEDREVVRDGKLITSRKPEDLPAFCRAILEVLRES